MSYTAQPSVEPSVRRAVAVATVMGLLVGGLVALRNAGCSSLGHPAGPSTLTHRHFEPLLTKGPQQGQAIGPHSWQGLPQQLHEGALQLLQQLPRFLAPALHTPHQGLQRAQGLHTSS